MSDVLHFIKASGASAEPKNLLISPIAIFVPLFTSDDFKEKNKAFYFENFEENLKGHIMNKTQKYV